MKLRFLLLAAVALTTACSPSQTVWHKEGAEPEELKLAQRICSRESQSFRLMLEGSRASDTFGSGSEGGGEPRGNSISSNVYRDCMERQGWRRYRDSQRN